MKNFIKKAAFTLAEVLITLTILGIVAYLVIPNIVQSYKKTLTVNRLKIAYSMLNDAVSLSFIENKYPNGNLGATDIFNNYFKPYLNISKDCGTNSNKGCFKDNSWYYLSSSSPDNSSSGGYSSAYFHQVLLKNGMSLAIYNNKNVPKRRILIYVDIDGPKHGKSRLGQDIFAFMYVDPNNLASNSTALNFKNQGYFFAPGYMDGKSVLYSVFYDKDRQFMLDNCKKGGDGMNCAALIVKDGWKINNDYPWGYANR